MDLNLRPACSIEQVPSQPRLHRETLSGLGWRWKKNQNSYVMSHVPCCSWHWQMFCAIGIFDTVCSLGWSSWSSAWCTVGTATVFTYSVIKVMPDVLFPGLHRLKKPVIDFFKLIQNKSGHCDLKLFVVLVILKIFTFFSLLYKRIKVFWIL